MNFWNENETEKTTTGFPFDRRLYKHDVMGSIAHCTMLSEQEIITEKDGKAIQKALTEIFYDITSEKISLVGVTDILALIDNELYDRIGALAKKINIARTNDDRIALDARLYVREIAQNDKYALKNLINAIITVGENNLATVVPTCYHGASAQPTTVAHVLMASAEAFARDCERFDAVYASANVMPLYSAYGTGLRLPVSRKRVAELLKFDSVTANSLDALTDGDYIHEYLLASTLTLKHVSALASKLFAWIGDKNYATVSDKYTTQSPVSYTAIYCDKLAELKGKVNVASSLLFKANAIDCGCNSPARKNYELINTVFDAQFAVFNALKDLADIVATLTFNETEMLKNATMKYSTAIDCVDYLISKGADQNDAYAIVGKLCAYCNENGKRLDTITLENYNEFSPLFESDIIPAMRVKNATRLRKHEGEPSDVSVRAEIRNIVKKIAKLAPDLE